MTHPAVEEFDDFTLTAILNNALEMLEEGHPLQAAFEFGRWAGYLKSAQKRRGDGVPPESEEVDAQIRNVAEMFAECAQETNNNPALWLLWDLGRIEAMASELFPKGLYLQVRRMVQKDRAILGETSDVHRAAIQCAARHKYNSYVPPGFGAPIERTSNDEDRTSALKRCSATSENDESAADEGDASD